MKFANIVFALASSVFASDAAKIGEEGFTVPPFSCFGTTAKAKWEMTVAESDLSGATYDPESGNIFVVNNGDRKVYEVSNGGSGYIWNTLVNTFDVSSKTKDLEGISALGSRQFAITDENPASIIKITLASNGTVTGDVTFGTGGRPHTGTAVLTSGIPAAGSNLGFEGTTKIGNDYYAIQEQNPTKLWKLSGGKSPIAAYSGDLKNSTGYEITSVGGMTRGGDATDEVFLVTKVYVGSGRDSKTRYKQQGILRYQLSTRTVIERFGGEVCKMSQPEGLTFWKEGTKIMMLVVGESTQARIYEADASCTDSIGDISTLMATCEEKVKLSADCEKTKVDGGCGWRRCDTSVTPHTKICADDSKCTEAECLAHCTNSSFAVADAVKGRCTHWAYDAKESECYIFSGCNQAGWSEDFTLYAMQDPTCERTRHEYPLGCEHRRCDKSESTHSKVCTDDSAETQCTLAECEKKCRDHTAFTCSSYAYDVKEQECYIFETCVNERFEQDYSLYVLTDPTCDRQRDTKDSPGCTQRMCDKDVTTHDHVCMRDSESQCTKNECELHCAAKVFEEVGEEAFCDHWAYDTAHKECYLFHGCTGEKFSDDYDLFFQTYGERVALRKTDSYLKLRDARGSSSGGPVASGGPGIRDVSGKKRSSDDDSEIDTSGILALFVAVAVILSLAVIGLGCGLSYFRGVRAHGFSGGFGAAAAVGTGCDAGAC